LQARHRQRRKLRRADRAEVVGGPRVPGIARQVGIRRLRCRGVRRVLRAKAVLHAPVAHRARQGPAAHRAPVGDHGRRRSAAGDSGRLRGDADYEAQTRRIPGRPRRPHLPRRSARQSHDALSARSGSVENAEGPAAPAQILPGRMSRPYRLLVLAALALAFVVVVAGAYVRLSDAGLGCPDWPLCYGRPLPGGLADGAALAKAWKEMGHRYLAGSLGLLILVLGLWSWRTRRSRWLASSILAVVLFQGSLGAWTVTMLLRPAIVTAHLLGGMTTLALLTWLALSLLTMNP